jgi:hypothetical protein
MRRNCSCVCRYGDGSNLHSDTLPNEPKASHLAAMHRALAQMSSVLVANRVQTRADAVGVVSCPAVVPARHAACVDGTNGTGNVACSMADSRQHFLFGGKVNGTGTIAYTPSSLARDKHGRTAALCVSGACPTMTNVSGCAPLPLLPCDPSDPAQQWTSVVTAASMRLVNKANGGCLSGWSKHATPGVATAVPLTGVAQCAEGWGTAVMNWNP